MSDLKLIKKIENIFQNIIKKKANSKSNNRNTKGWDSLNHVKLILSLEKNFKIKFALSEFDQLNSFSNIKKIIKSKIK